MPILNFPPGWPAPPAGWTPPTGWQPDPSWPPAPADHVWWIEDATTASSAAAFGVPSLVPDDEPDTAPERLTRRAVQQPAMAAVPGGGPQSTPPTTFAVPSLAPDEEAAAVGVAAPVAPAAVVRPAAEPPRSQADAMLAYAATAPDPDDVIPVPDLGTRPPVVAEPVAYTAPLVDPVALIAELERRAGRKAMAMGVVLLVLGVGLAVAGYLVTVPVAVYAVLGVLALLGLGQLIRGSLVRSRAEESALRRVLNP